MPEGNLYNPATPTLDHFIQMHIEVGKPAATGADANGERKLVPITGGSFAGKINGSVLAGGSDAIWIRPDGCIQIHARYCLQTGNGSILYVEDRGYRHGPEFVMARLAQGQDVDPGQYYFRTCLSMETSASDLTWLNKILFIGSGCRRAGSVVIDLYQLG
ncbi:MAG: DUF3237 domain-containing protein [Gammaproteobacteria bacterium]|nr:DUF3237 domain-containing protein [Pseudomonadales bacterium]MCP5345325.1 DUF3237 domain-containing protein [Pseudomonadales bacterium]